MNRSSCCGSPEIPGPAEPCSDGSNSTNSQNVGPSSPPEALPHGPTSTNPQNVRLSGSLAPEALPHGSTPTNLPDVRLSGLPEALPYGSSPTNMSDNQAAAPSESSFDDPSSTEDFLALGMNPFSNKISKLTAPHRERT